MERIFSDFETPQDLQISARRQNMVLVKKNKTLPNSRICCPGRPKNEIKRKLKER